MSTYKARQKALRSSTHKFLATSALTAAGLVSMGITAAHAQNVAADALPQGAEVTRGSASYDYSQPNTLTIEQHAALTSAEYKGGFNIGRDAAVLMLQEGGDIFVHIDKSDNTSYIEGFFSGSGSNYVLNKNGVMITGTARIDMNSFVASTAASLDLDKLEDGQAVFTDFGDGAIVIEEGAQVTVAEAGLAAFVSPFVSNAGVINAKMGTVAIGAGETVTLDLYGDGLVELAVDGELEDALIENTGTISAEGGNVQISARAAKDAVDNIINVDGIVTASSASVQGGKIVLSGGDKGVVSVKGIVDASGTDGGDISVMGQNVHVADTAELSVDGGKGSSGEGDGGLAYIYGNNVAIFEGSLTGKGGVNGGDGSNSEISGGKSVGFYGNVNLGATNGEVGTLLIDPEHLTISSAGFSADLVAAFTLGLFGNININDQALANVLHNNNVNLWATETLSTASDIDISEYDYDVVDTPGHLESCGFFCWNWVPTTYINVNGITANDLTLAAREVNLVHDVTLGAGALRIADLTAADSVLGFGIVNPPHDIIVDELNLDGKIYKRENLADASFATLANDSQLFTTANTINVFENASIQQGIQFADESALEIETVNIGDGTWNENVVVDRSLILNGDGTTATTILDGLNHTGTGIHVTADNVSLNGMIIRNYNYGINVDSEILNLSMDDIVSEHNAYAGFHVANTGGIDGLDVSNSHFDDNDFRTGNSNDFGYGWYFAKGDSGTNPTTVTNVTVTDTTFSGNSQKGMYIEKLDNASFTNIDVIDSGTLAGGVGFGNAGIDINLKYGTYQNISFNDLTVSGSGLNNAGKRGNAVTIKARNDEAGPGGLRYNDFPASLSNVTINDANIDAAGDVGLAFGNNINGGSVTNSEISGPEAVAIYGGASNLTIGGGNTIDAAGEGLSSIGLNFGVGINGGSGNIIDDNVITADGIGVAVEGSAGARVRNNEIGTPGHGPQKGVYADSAQDIQVNDNIINGATEVGVHVKNSHGTGYGGGQNDVDIWSNVITNAAGATGVLIENSNYATVGWHPTNPFANANTGGNTITGGENGVVVTGSNNAYIAHNDISGQNGGDGPASGDGIYVADSAGVTIFDNDIHDVEDEGIQGDNIDNAIVDDNLIEDAGRAGISLMRGSDNQTISNNEINRTGHSGIFSSGKGTLNITGNTISDVGSDHGGNNFRNDGIHVDGAFANEGNANPGTPFAGGGLIDDNTIDGFTHAGIELVNVDSDLTVLNNTIGATSGGPVGIYNNGSDGTVIDNNTIANSETGILVNPSNDVTIHDNAITGGKNGIIVREGENVTITANTVTGATDTLAGRNASGWTTGIGILVDGVLGNVDVSGNTANNNTDGIRILNTDASDYGDVTVSGNTTDNNDDKGIIINRSDKVLVSGNFADNNNTGIWVELSDDVTLENNEVTGSDEDGVHLRDSVGTLLSGNDILGNDRNGVWVERSNSTKLYDNEITGTGGTHTGVKITGSSNVDVGDEDLKVWVKTGFWPWQGYWDVTSKGNTISNFDNGVTISGGADNSVVNNEISDVDYGVKLSGTAGAVVRNNEITGNSVTGIDVTAGSHNALIENNTLDHFNTGISIAGSNDVTIDDNTLTDVENGILADNANNLTVTDNDLEGRGGYGTGIGVTNSDNVKIGDYAIVNLLLVTVLDSHGNEIEDFGNGIDAENVTSLRIVLNEVSGNDTGTGIRATNSEGAQIGGGTSLHVLGIPYTGSLGNTVEHFETGINVQDSDDADIKRNDVHDIDGNGIEVTNSRRVEIKHNDVGYVGGNGIFVVNAALAEIISNEVHDIDNDGIKVDNSANVEIKRNYLEEIEEAGIDVNNALRVQIINNEINDVDDNGIEVTNSRFANVRRNDVYDIWDGNGVFVSDSNRAQIINNRTDNVDENGIFVNDSRWVEIKRNLVSDSGNDGIKVVDSRFAHVARNLVTLSTDDGIDIERSRGAKVNNNLVFFSGDNGIDVERSRETRIARNIVAFNVNDAIHVERSRDVVIARNIAGAGFGDGIDVERSNGAVIRNNLVGLVGENGIELQNSDNSTISGNFVVFTNDNGIYVNPSNNVLIDGNIIDFTNNDGIDVNGGDNITISNNEIGTLAGDIGDDGIDIDGTSNVTIKNNQITSAFEAGIELTDTDVVNVLFNDISDNGVYGLWARGPGNTSVVLSGNTFTDNPTGARFESGAIDLTGDANTFNNGQVALQFEPNDPSDDLSLIGNTLGTTIFSGQSQFYVQLANGALFNPGTPTIINGINSTYDGFSPSSQGGILTQAQLNAIEAKLFDFDDLGTLGQIFVGSTIALDVEEFFNQFGFYGAGFSGFNLTFLGLPPVTLPTGNLNNIQTFAGPGDLNNISPAAGGEDDAESLADIEPAAGAEETSCWTDIWNAPVNGGVNFNYSGDPTESLNAAASCGS